MQHKKRLKRKQNRTVGHTAVQQLAFRTEKTRYGLYCDKSQYRNQHAQRYRGVNKHRKIAVCFFPVALAQSFADYGAAAVPSIKPIAPVHMIKGIIRFTEAKAVFPT